MHGNAGGNRGIEGIDPATLGDANRTQKLMPDWFGLNNSAIFSY